MDALETKSHIAKAHVGAGVEAARQDESESVKECARNRNRMEKYFLVGAE